MNLFIISGVNHLYSVQSIIKQYKYENNILYILKLQHTGENDWNLNNLRIQIIPNLFKEVHELNIEQLNIYYSEMCDKGILLDNVFMTTYTGVFYPIAKACKKNGITLNLYEEGLSTYKLKLVKEKSAMERLADKIFKRKVFIKPKVDYQPILPGTVVRQSKIRKVKSLGKKIIQSIKNDLKYRVFSGFDQGFVTYPEKVSKVVKVKKCMHDYKLHYYMNERVQEESNSIKLTLPDKSALFMSQPMYHTALTEEEYVEVVYKFLEGLPDENILIKFHPRETEDKKEYFKSKFRSSKKNIIFIEGNDGLQFPIEILLYSPKIKKIIAFSSTSMIYAPLINKNLECISLFNVINEIHQSKNGAKFIMNEIKEELIKFRHIKMA